MGSGYDFGSVESSDAICPFLRILLWLLVRFPISSSLTQEFVLHLHAVNQFPLYASIHYNFKSAK